MTPRQTRALCILPALWIVWGPEYLAVRIMVRTVPPMLGAGTALLIAGLIAFLFRLITGGLMVTRRTIREGFIDGVLYVLLGQGAVAVAEQHIESGTSALIVSAMPFWATLIRRIRHERLELGESFGTIFGLAGVALVVASHLRLSADSIGSVALLSIASLSWAAAEVRSSHRPQATDATSQVAFQMFFGGALLIAGSWPLGNFNGFAFSHISAEGYISFSYVCLAVSLLGYLLFFWLLERTSIGAVNTCAFTSPIIAFFAGALIGERPGLLSFVGLLLIAGSIALVLRTFAAGRVTQEE